MREKHNFLIGQRVIVGNEIGTVVQGQKDARPKYDWVDDYYVWVHLPSKGYASYYDMNNVKPLPNGQL